MSRAAGVDVLQGARRSQVGSGREETQGLAFMGRPVGAYICT
jgi:hypothetical protein